MAYEPLSVIISLKMYNIWEGDVQPLTVIIVQ